MIVFKKSILCILSQALASNFQYELYQSFMSWDKSGKSALIEANTSYQEVKKLCIKESSMLNQIEFKEKFLSVTCFLQSSVRNSESEKILWKAFQNYRPLYLYHRCVL